MDEKPTAERSCFVCDFYDKYHCSSPNEPESFVSLGDSEYIWPTVGPDCLCELFKP